MHEVRSSCGKYIYHICIIDYLQLFNYKKKIERLYKTKRFNINPQDVSSIDAISYGKRFMFYMKNVLLKDDK